ncbi:nucleotidyltransferase domain-containing protein [Clostridium sp.]|uniref:nucleotidyltransferase domain-containing protein n=1 Tax=Clostridium sp. TaxID=1506 RepID=UPI00399464B0
MKKEVLEYQKAYKGIIKDLENNKNVLGVTVFGSLITGDIWEGSDIDMFVIVDKMKDNKKDFFGMKHGIEVHMRMLSKENFINFKDNYTGGSSIHRKLISSKLVIGKDKDIVNKYNELKILNNVEREKWNLAYLGKVISELAHCKKALENGKIYAAFNSAMKLGDSYSRLYLNLNNYLLNSDPFIVALSLNNEFKKRIDKIVKEHKRESIEEFIEFIEKFLRENIVEATTMLIDSLKEAGEPLDSSYLSNCEKFSRIEIPIEKILKELSKRGIIKSSLREYESSEGNKLIEELVYYYEEGKN